MQKTAKTPAERQELVAIRMRIGDSQRRNQNPVFSEIVTLSITIDADAEPGPRQVRLETALGLSNALTFVVGAVPEFTEKEEKASKADSELTVTLPAIVNGRLIPGDVDRMQFPLRQPGQYAPGDIDRYRFAARKGQDLVCIVSARDLMPYLADAVPGWIQATLTLSDASGREIAYGDDYRYQPDPVLHVKIPADGDYVLEIKDALYRGREDFVYRIAIGEFPYITSVFPLGGPAGSKTAVQVSGWNLQTTRVTMDATRAEPGVSSVTATGRELPANRVPFAVDTLPETLEREPNSPPKDAQRLTLPVIVNGRIQEPGDVDFFSFQGKAGQPVVAEVHARRLGSPLDSSLELIGPTGARIAFNDDFEDKASGLLTHHADSYLAATLPSDGTYLLRLTDVQRQGGSECRVPAAGRPAAARLRVARHAAGGQCRRRDHRSDHGPRHQARRLLGRHRRRAEGRPGRIRAERSSRSCRCGPRPHDAHRGAGRDEGHVVDCRRRPRDQSRGAWSLTAPSRPTT